jgi:hypothetical protein
MYQFEIWGQQGKFKPIPGARTPTPTPDPTQEETEAEVPENSDLRVLIMEGRKGHGMSGAGRVPLPSQSPELGSVWGSACAHMGALFSRAGQERSCPERRARVG